MRAVVQRVSQASVTMQSELGRPSRQIGHGLVILLGVAQEDQEKDAAYLAAKIANLRIFEDEQQKLNLSLLDKGGEALVVSQFTLYGNCHQGRRPGFTQAAPAELGRKLYETFVQELQKQGVQVQTGQFQTTMTVQIYNEGPVTLLLDSQKTF